MLTEIILLLVQEILAMLAILMAHQSLAQPLKLGMLVMLVQTEHGDLTGQEMNDAYQINIAFYGKK